MVKIFKTYLLCITLAGISMMPVLVAVWYCASQAIIEHQMETALQQEALETITIKTANIIWLKDGREILFNYKPFDVKRIYQVGDESVISGLYDFKEKLLKQKLRNLNGGDRQHGRTLKIVRQLYLFGPASPIHFCSLLVRLASKTTYGCCKDHYQQGDYSFLNVPPPRSMSQICGQTLFSGRYFHRTGLQSILSRSFSCRKLSGD